MPIQLSIIIVNYNVKAFLEQCLYSVFNSIKNIETEIFVVDNNSVDESLQMVKTQFPKVKLICNNENKGFAFACNQALNVSSGKYVLLLNPDTIIREDSLELCIEFMEQRLDAGALGVKMIDGKGKFLPESKRSLPTASSAFFKMFGLSALFPKSRAFGKYQLRYLNENEIHQVEVLSGAFMFIKKSVLDEIGMLDETFFMYGEDIDLSYRIMKAGYKNYYFPRTTIIHFKGESTKKASFQYVKVFYNAMLIFAKKHYNHKHSSVYSLIIKIAIYFRAAISLISRILKTIFLPIIDFSLIYLIYCQIVPLWENFRFMGIKAYSNLLTNIYIPVYILIWLAFLKYFKVYKILIPLKKQIKPVLWGTVFILACYSLLPENYRYSRALILIGTVICLISTSLIRIAFRFVHNQGKGFSYKTTKNALLLGSCNNNSFLNYPKYLDQEFVIHKLIKLENNSLNNQQQINTLCDIIKIYHINTIIFFAKDIEASDIINTIVKTRNKNLDFKMILPVSPSMIGSQSVINLEYLPGFKLNLISEIRNQMKKRILDIVICTIFFVFSPVFLLRNNLCIFYRTLSYILLNKLTWVSYVSEEGNMKVLPRLKPGLFSPMVMYEDVVDENKTVYEINLTYAKNYSVINDIVIIYKSLKKTFRLPVIVKKNKENE